MSIEVIKNFTIIGLWMVAAIMVWLIVFVAGSAFLETVRDIWNGGKK